MCENLRERERERERESPYSPVVDSFVLFFDEARVFCRARAGSSLREGFQAERDGNEERGSEEREREVRALRGHVCELVPVEVVHERGHEDATVLDEDDLLSLYRYAAVAFCAHNSRRAYLGGLSL